MSFLKPFALVLILFLNSCQDKSDPETSDPKMTHFTSEMTTVFADLEKSAAKIAERKLNSAQLEDAILQLCLIKCRQRHLECRLRDIAPEGYEFEDFDGERRAPRQFEIELLSETDAEVPEATTTPELATCKELNDECILKCKCETLE